MASQRILGDNRTTDTFSNHQHALEITRARNHNDQARYLKLYNIDLRDTSHYDCIIDTSYLTPEEVVNKILEHFEQHNKQRPPLESLFLKNIKSELLSVYSSVIDFIPKKSCKRKQDN